MAFPSHPIGRETLPKADLMADKQACQTAGPCGVGKKALYIGSRFVSRWYYIPWTEISRVYKRVAMSSGGFSGKGVFGSMSYLVVQYPGGEKKCYVKHERDVDAILEWIADHKPSIPTTSEEGEKRLAAAAAAEEARYRKNLSEGAEKTLAQLQDARRFLEQKRTLPEGLTRAAKQKRVADQIPPALRIFGALAGIGGALAALAGLILLLTGHNLGWYLIIGGGALFFLMLSANLLPNKQNSIKKAQQNWDEALSSMEKRLRDYGGSFPLPAQYAHPIVLDRMIRVIREGRADSAEKAYELMKQDLKALNASVTVSQSEYDEVVKIKPLFLLCDYRDQL